MAWSVSRDSLYAVLNNTLDNEQREDLIVWFLYLKLFFSARRKCTGGDPCSPARVLDCFLAHHKYVETQIFPPAQGLDAEPRFEGVVWRGVKKNLLVSPRIAGRNAGGPEGILSYQKTQCCLFFIAPPGSHLRLRCHSVLGFLLG